MGTASAGGDRLSNLPDCLLHSVLSCLRSRQVVHTSLLSRRWRHLWRAVPCVDIDYRDFLDEPEPEPEPEAFYRAADGAFDAAMYHAHMKAQDKRMGREYMQRRDFEDFADSVLPLNVAWPLDAYRLHLGGDVDLRRGMERWIRRGLARRPAELLVACDYDHGNGHHRTSKDPFFSLGIFSRAAGDTSRLRRLSLSGLILFECFEEELRSRCPVLEDLELVNCEIHRQSWDGHANRIRIASRSLKKLAIESSSSEARLCLTAPALVSLNVGMPVAVEEEMPSLAVASISCHAGVLALLKSLQTARALELRWFNTWALVGEEPELFREFPNLRTLVLTECDIGDGCQVLAHVLKSVPSLERIVLQDCRISGSCLRPSHRGAPLRRCCQNLKYIQVKYEGHDVAHLPVAALKGIPTNAVKLHRRGQRPTSPVEWLDWMQRIVCCSSHAIGMSQQYVAAASVVAPLSEDSDEEHESTTWKHLASKKHARDNAFKARRRGRLA